MSTIASFLPFVNGQAAAQGRLAAKYARDEKRSLLHIDSEAQFQALCRAIEAAAARIDELEAERQARTLSQVPVLTLQPTELEDLPQEVLAELSEGAVTDRADLAIFQVIDERGGIASLDQIIVGLYRKTGEHAKRNTLTSKLYRMGQKGQIFSVPDRKGVYSTLRLSDEEWAKAFRLDASSDA